MWTNVFRIGELHVISWFQFLPFESDPNMLSEKSLKAEQKDAATYMIISAHLQLQNEGFLSAWTNSFVGPWDPSQGMHNPDEKIKLWLFLPGRHSSIVENAQAAVSRLRVVGSGLWLAPGDSEEVAVALSQALRNSIERALRGLSYVRFGDVFTRSNPSTQHGKIFRRPQPTLEFIFAATEEAIYVHAIVSAKHIRGVCSDDMERMLVHCYSRSNGEGLPVIVAPNGMLGRLVGCCPSDLVKQVYGSKLKSSYGSAAGLTYVTQSSGCQLRGQSCYIEVALGCSSACTDKALETNSYLKNKALHPAEDSEFATDGGQRKQESVHHFPVLERTFIYPAEAVVIPLTHRAFACFSRKRLWLQNCTGTSLFEMWPLWNFPGSFFEHSHWESLLGLGVGFNPMRVQKHFNSSSNSISSSISSVSSTTSESEYAVAAGDGELEADADSLTCRQSVNDHLENDGRKMVSKRLRTDMTETSAQSGKVGDMQDAFKSGYNVVEANNSVVAEVANVQGVSLWGWEEDDGVGMDIQTLLSEFGDFGDFFENDILIFGEPPGTAESQALVFPGVDCGDITSSPCTGGMEMPDQRLSPSGIACFEGFNQNSVEETEDTRIKTEESAKDMMSSAAGSYSLVPSVGKFDYLTKAEAMLTFASEYAAVEIPNGEVSVCTFTNPYLPTSKKGSTSYSSSNAYVYSATPPSPSFETSEEKPQTLVKRKPGLVSNDGSSSVQSLKLYTLIQNWTKGTDKRSRRNDVHSLKGEAPSSVSGITSLSSSITLLKKNEKMFDAGNFLLSLKTTLATEIECIMFQAAMCRVRHTLLSLSSRVPVGLRSSILDLLQAETSNKPDIIISKYEIQKKDSIPVRIAGDIDGGMHDGSLTAQVGVWRPVGTPKGIKPLNLHSTENPSMPVNILTDDGLNVIAPRQPLLDLLDAMSLLVQQSTSFVDVALDADEGDGPYYSLALQEQRRRGFSCAPSMVHAGCGGILATCHSVDIAGVDLVDPLAADAPVSSVISLLQSDIKVALKSAFTNLDGPLSVIDWCKGRSQIGDSGSTGDAYSFPYTASETRDSSSTVSLGGESMSPPQSTGASPCIREGARTDESSLRRSSQDTSNSEAEQQKGYSRFRSTLAVLPLPAILVGYQDDWLKTSTNCLQLWEKAPLEPYALPKPVNFFAICPDIDLLTSAAIDFFQQLGTVYEVCKLGTHSPHINGGQTEFAPGKCLPSGLVLVDCPQQVKISGSHLTAISSISDYFLALYKGWNMKSFVNSLTKVIKDLKLASSCSANQKEGSSGPCTVVYVVCPFPEPSAVLQTLVECSVALGSAVLLPDKERRSMLHSQIAKALNCTAATDEASASNVLMLSGFSIPKLVLQIVTVESLLRINRGTNELAVLKDIAFTVYNKARRIPRAVSANDMLHSTTFSGRSQSTMMHVNSPIPGLWKDCLVPRIPREAEYDTSLRPGTWENSWQTSRTSGLSDPIKPADLCGQDDGRYMFEPLFILAGPGSIEHSGVSESSNSKTVIDDSSGVYLQSSTLAVSSDTGVNSLDGLEHDHKAASLHCCYGWTEDWRWLVCIWTDARGELLDSHIFPFGGISSRQDTKVLQSLFIQVLRQGCQILSSSPDASAVRPRDIIITRFGSFFELECQEWQKAIYSFGGNEVRKWPLQLRRSIPEGIPSNANGTSLQQQEIGLLQERNLPSSPSASLYGPHSKPSFMKGALGQSSTKKQLLAGQTGMDISKGLLQLVQSISLVGVTLDHSLHLILQADMSSSGGGTQNSSGHTGYLEGFSPVKSIGSMPASYLLIPSPSLRYLSPATLQLPTCLTSESPPLAHLLHSKGSATPLATGYVVSKAVPTMRKDPAETTKDDWPSILAISLVDHYGGSSTIQEKIVRGAGSSSSLGKQGRSFTPDTVNRDYELEIHMVLESVAAELHSLSWMTASPIYAERRTTLPFHCDMLLRLRRLLHYADKELSRPPEKAEQV
ncbi:mediator of RNA polymerase II transcription subunit 13 [Typha latifolia]|uniref:mediator of RNA polymerase II transcription subunit 13 n=1 Tax=Typha latifolia TaxID=4733 RepID=UPI003C2B2E4F